MRTGGFSFIVAPLKGGCKGLFGGRKRGRGWRLSACRAAGCSAKQESTASTPPAAPPGRDAAASLRARPCAKGAGLKKGGVVGRRGFFIKGGKGAALCAGFGLRLAGAKEREPAGRGEAGGPAAPRPALRARSAPHRTPAPRPALRPCRRLAPHRPPPPSVPAAALHPPPPKGGRCFP